MCRPACFLSWQLAGASAFYFAVQFSPSQRIIPSSSLLVIPHTPDGRCICTHGWPHAVRRYAEILELARNRSAIVLPAWRSEEADMPIQIVTGALPTVEN